MKHKRTLIILVLSGIAAILAHLYGPAAMQRRGMRDAASYRDEAAPALAADGRFAGVSLDVTTHPGLLVRGAVPDQQALSELQRRLQPPESGEFQIIMHVQVTADAATRPAGTDESRPR